MYAYAFNNTCMIFRFLREIIYIRGIAKDFRVSKKPCLVNIAHKLAKLGPFEAALVANSRSKRISMLVNIFMLINIFYPAAHIASHVTLAQFPANVCPVRVCNVIFILILIGLINE